MPVNEQAVTIPSAGLRLAGTVRVPDGVRPGERRPAFLVLHGFGSNNTSSNVMQPTKVLGDLGYVTLRFDMRGCGDSEGELGRVICLEQVEDTGNALTFLAKHPAVDPDRIGVIGSSFGGAVAVYAGGVDRASRRSISNGGWGDGERKFRGQHPTPEAWKKFTDMLEKGRDHRAKFGKPLMVPRYDIVPIPPHLRTNLAQELDPRSSPAETAQSMYDFRADDVVGKIAPRPLLLLHAANDSVTPTEQSIELFKRAGQPTELHLFSDADHFMFAEGNTRGLGPGAQLARRLFPGGEVNRPGPKARSWCATGNRSLHPRRLKKGKAGRFAALSGRRTVWANPGTDGHGVSRLPRYAHHRPRDRHQRPPSPHSITTARLDATMFRHRGDDAGAADRQVDAKAVAGSATACCARRRIPAPSAATRNGWRSTAAPRSSWAAGRP